MAEGSSDPRMADGMAGVKLDGGHAGRNLLGHDGMGGRLRTVDCGNSGKPDRNRLCGVLVEAEPEQFRLIVTYSVSAEGGRHDGNTDRNRLGGIHPDMGRKIGQEVTGGRQQTDLGATNTMRAGGGLALAEGTSDPRMLDGLAGWRPDGERLCRDLDGQEGTGLDPVGVHADAEPDLIRLTVTGGVADVPGGHDGDTDHSRSGAGHQEAEQGSRTWRR